MYELAKARMSEVGDYPSQCQKELRYYPRCFESLANGQERRLRLACQIASAFFRIPFGIGWSLPSNLRRFFRHRNTASAFSEPPKPPIRNNPCFSLTFRLVMFSPGVRTFYWSADPRELGEARRKRPPVRMPFCLEVDGHSMTAPYRLAL